MTHQGLNGSEIIPIIQERRRESVPHHMGMDSLMNQCFFYHGFDEAVNGLGAIVNLPSSRHHPILPAVRANLMALG